MNTFEGFKALLGEKSGKKLVALSVAVFLIITVIVFFSVYKLCENIALKQMDGYLDGIPKIIDSHNNEMRMRNRVYEDDILARAELGLKLYGEENGLTDAEKLERMRVAVSAASVSLLDEDRQTLSTTGPVSAEAVFSACVQTLEPRTPHLELYLSDGAEKVQYDGKGFVLFPVPGSAKRSLVFEFPCETMLELYNAINDWSAFLEQMFSGGDVIALGKGSDDTESAVVRKDMAAFAKTGDKLAGYPLEGFTPEEMTRLYGELDKIFESGESFRKTKDGALSKLITLLGRRYLAMLMEMPEENTDILLTYSLRGIIANGFFIALSISALIGCGIWLLQLYIARRLLREKDGKGAKAVSRRWVCGKTWPGIVTVLVVTVLFSSMLLLLEDRTDASYDVIINQNSLQYDIELYKSQERTVRNTFVGFYQARAQMLADFLTERPDYQNRAGLQELSRIARTDYLMRFDRAGKEVASSNSYTGFAVGENLSEDYRAVLMGYPDAVVGPAADPYTGRMQLGAAILMTDGEGQPDGFLLAVYSAGELNAELERMSYENVVNSYAVQKGHIAAAINDGDGRFIAHTDPDMIGLKAEDYLPDFTIGSSFEGFTSYKGESMCVSASAADGKTLLFMAPEKSDAYTQASSAPAALIALLILALLYYPTAGVLIAQALAEADGKIQPRDRPRIPMMTFVHGYVYFLTAFTLFALIATANGWWDSFDYVFSWEWSRGLHLFSVWAALFVLSVTLCGVYLLQSVLSFFESHLSLRAKTVTRLVHSLITYAASLFLVFFILDMFGVNTTALIASAGIISIAVGMGAQSMAADLLAGFFMMLEGSIHVGDYVSASGVTGHVTDMGIRTTEITDDEGNVVILNNSRVSPVRNMTQKQAQDDGKTE